ncbi:MAG: hypothetical protein EHM70_18040 [Chloroflexota bacterium]|nr:MAG: hypothetical protein EHM70_18040 [Chloroflexota bacterium]
MEALTGWGSSQVSPGFHGLSRGFTPGGGGVGGGPAFEADNSRRDGIGGGLALEASSGGDKSPPQYMEALSGWGGVDVIL